MKILITGGAGFIGSAVIRELIRNTKHAVVSVDKLTYAGNLESLAECSEDARYVHELVDICDAATMQRVFTEHEPDMVMHLAAETHVDRSIDGPGEFMMTNFIGTYTMLKVSRSYYKNLSPEGRVHFRFHHVSTDEVYGDLESEGYFTEESNYNPSSPYSASKASSDHLVQAWHRTYGLPTVMSHCSNNYGPYQFPEKLIPLTILNALEGKVLPIYGDGKQVRDWLYVEDHARALIRVAMEGKVGEKYHIGGNNELQNRDVVESICALLDQKMKPEDKPLGVESYRELISFVADRPGHDVRYAMDASKIREELGWVREESFESGIEKTVDWYLSHQEWCGRVQDGSYQGERLGVGDGDHDRVWNGGFKSNNEEDVP